MASWRTPALKISHVRCDQRGLGQRGESVAVERDDPAAGDVERGTADHRRRPADDRHVDAGLGGQRRESTIAVVPPPHVQLGGVAARVGLEGDAGIGHVDDRNAPRGRSGVTGSPSTTSRRDVRSATVVTRRPSGRNAGTPGTRSTQASSCVFGDDGCRAGVGVDAQQLDAALIAGLDDISRPASVQSTVAMYGKDSRSQSTSTREPSSPSTCSVTMALSVPAAG